MRGFTTIAGLFFVIFVSFAQALAGTTNQITQGEVLRVASSLRVGMREEDAAALLERAGLKTVATAGDSFGWYHCFSVSNGFSLVLDIKPKHFRRDGAWADGLVRGAFVESNGTNRVFIKLKNAP